MDLRFGNIYYVTMNQLLNYFYPEIHKYLKTLIFYPQKITISTMAQPSSKSCIVQIAQIIEEPLDFLLGLNLTQVKVKECRNPSLGFTTKARACKGAGQ
jgi:hypothetical protein